MENRVKEIIMQKLNISEDELTNNINDVSIWDSLVKVEIIFEIEEEFNILFAEKELEMMQNPQDLLNIVSSKEL